MALWCGRGIRASRRAAPSRTSTGGPSCAPSRRPPSSCVVREATCSTVTSQSGWRRSSRAADSSRSRAPSTRSTRTTPRRCWRRCGTFSGSERCDHAPAQEVLTHEARPLRTRRGGEARPHRRGRRRARSVAGGRGHHAGPALTRGPEAPARDADGAAPLVRGRPRLGAPLSGIGKIVCIGLNYTDHAREVGLPLPTEPLLFIKATSAINGPGDPIVRPREAVKLDYEVELGVVIGRDARNVSEADALGHVAAYCIVDDVSERAFQMEHGGTTTKGKSADTFAPIGPWLVTADEARDPQALLLWTTVNGESRQRGSTANMIFPVRQLVAYVSRFMSLRAGDIVSTGTPAGVAHGMKPPRYLQPGDIVEMGITGLGVQKNRVVSR